MSILKGKKILVIDDVKDVRTVAKLVLEAAGATVSEASSVDEGLSIMTAYLPDLLITDLNLPIKTGFDLLKELRKTNTFSEIPAIVLSGRNDKDSITQAVDLGAKDYILKPIQSNTLLQKARKHLKDLTFLSCSFSTKFPSVHVTLVADVLKIHEAGLKIETSVKLAIEKTVSLNGELVTKLGCENVLTRTSSSQSPSTPGQQRYTSDLHYVGMSEATIKTIRTRIQEWK